jgi:hypothetical protein
MPHIDHHVASAVEKSLHISVEREYALVVAAVVARAMFTNPVRRNAPVADGA